MSIKTVVLVFTIVLVFCNPIWADSDSSHADIEVDVSRTIGEFKPLRGVNGPPYQVSREEPSKAPVDISAGYMEARVNLVRTHDSGVANIDSTTGNLAPLEGLTGLSPDAEKAVDMNVIFPDLNAGPTLPESYNFGPTDRLIEAIRATGAEVLFRLGRRGRTTAEPPADLVKYGEIIRHVVLHYDKGWADGFNDTVQYWEVWNEPDLGQIWWRGMPEQYYGLYEAAAKAVKSADPEALVGGSTIAFVNEPTPYREGFLAYVREHDLPLNFFSWHYYSVDANDPYDFVRIGRDIRSTLDSYGFQSTQSILDEWNYDFRTRRDAKPMDHASFVVSSLIYMQDGDIDQEALYRADREFGPEGSTPTKTGQGLIAVGRLADTPVRLQVSGGDTNGFAVQAGRSEDGRKVQILISNYEIPPELRGPRESDDVMHEKGLFDLKLLPRRTVNYDANGGYDLQVKGLDPDGKYSIECFRLTEGMDFSSLDRQENQGPQVRLQAELPPPSIELIVITKRQ